MNTSSLLGFKVATRTAGLAVALIVGASAASAQVLVNPGFESGLTGWTVVDQAGGQGSWYSQSGTSSPAPVFVVPPPPQGSFAAMTSQGGAGAHVLYQDFVVPFSVSQTNFSFSYYIANRASAFVTPATLAYNTGPNQQARVDIVTTTANVFSVLATDVLLNVFQTQVGDPLVSGYTAFSTDVTALFQAHAGQTLRLRFAETDNQLFFNFGVDNVGFSSPVPEPSTYGLLGGVALLALVARRRFAKRKALN